MPNYAKVGRPATYQVDHNYFDKYTLDNCYWAGFIAADGCISKNELIICLDRLDLDHLNSFKNSIKSTHPIKPPSSKQRDNCYRFAFRSTNITNDLCKNFNLSSKKTFTLKPPPIDQWELQLAYLIGLIDGDGCISVTKGQCEQWNYSKMTFSIYATYPILNWITALFIKIDPKLNNKSDHIYRKTETHAAFMASNHSMLYILQELNKIDVPKLKRKWEKVESYKYSKG